MVDVPHTEAALEVTATLDAGRRANSIAPKGSLPDNVTFPIPVTPAALLSAQAAATAPSSTLVVTSS